MPSAIKHFLHAQERSLARNFAAGESGIPADYYGYGGGTTGSGTDSGPPIAAATFAEKIAAAIGYGRIQLMPWIDPYTDEKPEHREAYRKMLRHAVVKAALLGKIWSVASLDLSMSPGGESPRAQEMADFALAAFTREITGRLKKLAETIFVIGLVDGHSISEKVWSEDLKERGPWRGRRFYRDLKAKDNVQLKVDEFRNIISVQSTRGNVEWDPADFVIYRNLAMFEGPGMSDLRACYGKVWMIDTAEKLRMVHLEKFTSPYFDVTIDDPNEEARTKREIAKATARSWIVHPTSVKIQAMQLASAAPATFTDTIRDLKEDVALSIAGAFLQMLTANAGGNMRGDSNTQKGTAELFVWALAAELCNIIDTQLTPGLIDENFAPGDDADYPTVSLGGINYSDLKSGIELDEIAQRMGAKLSRKAFAKKYGLQLAATPDDELAPPPAPPSPFGFTQVIGGPPSGANFRDGLADHCGGKGGKPGPCPTAAAGFSDPSPPAGADVALGGPDGRKAEALLRRSVSEGSTKLADLARAAVTRLIDQHGEAAAIKPKRLFTAEELGELADQLAATNATAELLGRARIAERAAEVERRRQGDGVSMHGEWRPGRFSLEPTPFRAFDESAGLTPMPPSEALAYFRRLFPSLGVDPERFGSLQERQAFTLAVATDETLLTAIQGIIADRLATGDGISTAPADIDAILEAAGVNLGGGYAETIFRTNMMDSYATGSQRELSANAEMFPAWQYSNPSDTRSRPAHADRDGKYWPTDTPFVLVRGAGIEDAANCRCVQIPIDKFEWEDLRAAGAVLESA